MQGLPSLPSLPDLDGFELPDGEEVSAADVDAILAEVGIPAPHRKGQRATQASKAHTDACTFDFLFVLNTNGNMKERERERCKQNKKQINKKKK